MSSTGSDGGMGHAATALNGLWGLGGIGDDEKGGSALDNLELSGQEECLPSVFRVGAAAVASTSAATLAVRELLSLRAPVGSARIDGRHASMAFRSERYFTVDGVSPPSPWSELSGYYRTLDEGWIQLHCNFAHHAAGVVDELRSNADRESVAAAISERDRFELEDALAERNMCATAFRSPEEWLAHPQGIASAQLPPIEIVKLGDAPVEPLPDVEDRALSSIRVIDMTRIIAGPVCTRFLAAHGATVMRIGAPHLPVIESIIGDSCMGKLATDLDLRSSADRARFETLSAGADVVVQGFRPGGLADLGQGPQDLAERRPGVIYASLSAYGHQGPWSTRRGFDSLVQTVSGIGWEGMEAAGRDRPHPLPAQALDHASGYLLAYGIAVALHRRATVGGSWMVRTSLAQVGHWITGLGRHDGLGIAEPAQPDDLIAYFESARGRLGVVEPVGSIDGADPRWDRPAPLLGSSPPVWP